MMRVSTANLFFTVAVVCSSILAVGAFATSKPVSFLCTSGIRTRSSFGNAARGKRGVVGMTVEEVEEVELDAEDRMIKSVDSVKKNLQSVRTGRANAAILDRVQVAYYGVLTPVRQMASISVPSAQQLTIEPYDKSTLADIERAITESDVGVTPNNDGSMIRINIPPLTEDRRKDMIKQCKAIGEEGKVAIRNIRRDGVDAVKKMEKDSDISKDQSLDGQDALQKLTDKFVKDIDEVVAKKEKDVMTV